MTFGRKLEEPDPWHPLPTGRQAPEPFTGIGWLEARTLIPSDNIPRNVRVMGVMPWPLPGTRRHPESSDPVDAASLEERIKALEAQRK